MSETFALSERSLKLANGFRSNMGEFWEEPMDVGRDGQSSHINIISFGYQRNRLTGNINRMSLYKSLVLIPVS